MPSDAAPERPMTLDLDAIEARAAKATVGLEVHIAAPGTPQQGCATVMGLDEWMLPEDAELIIHAASDLLALIAEVRRLQARAEQLAGEGWSQGLTVRDGCFVVSHEVGEEGEHETPRSREISVALAEAVLADELAALRARAQRAEAIAAAEREHCEAILAHVATPFGTFGTPRPEWVATHDRLERAREALRALGVAP